MRRSFRAVVAAAVFFGIGLPGNPSSVPEDVRNSLTIFGEVTAGNLFERPFGPGWSFRLEPGAFGWTIAIRDAEAADDLARLTPPFHFVPNPRDLEGWHFRNADNSGPNGPGEKNVNAPGEVREFIFSPQVGKTIDGPGATGPVTEEDIERVRRYGRGTLTILEYRLADAEPGKTARFDWLRFKVELSWPADRGPISSRPACRSRSGAVRAGFAGDC